MVVMRLLLRANDGARAAQSKPRDDLRRRAGEMLHQVEGNECAGAAGPALQWTASAPFSFSEISRNFLRIASVGLPPSAK